MCLQAKETATFTVLNILNSIDRSILYQCLYYTNMHNVESCVSRIEENKKIVQSMEKASEKAPFKRNERNFAQVFS